MEKKKYSLCLEVLRRMEKVGILDEIMLVGSWCILLYDDYFEGKCILPPLRTRDLDFLFPLPLKLKRKTDLFELLKDLGFVIDYKGQQGYITFQHPELIRGGFNSPMLASSLIKYFLRPTVGRGAQP